MHSHRCARWSVMIEKLGPDLIKAAEIIHVHQKHLNFNNIVEAGTGMLKNIGDVLDNGASLSTNIQIGHPHGIDLNTFEGVVRPTRTGTRNKNEIAGAPIMRKAAPRLGFPTNNR